MHAIRGIAYLIEDALAAMTTPSPDDRKYYKDRIVAVMMHATIDKAVFENINLVQFKIRL